jgi:hypothetical protein
MQSGGPLSTTRQERSEPARDLNCWPLETNQTQAIAIRTIEITTPGTSARLSGKIGASIGEPQSCGRDIRSYLLLAVVSTATSSPPACSAVLGPGWVKGSQAGSGKPVSIEVAECVREPRLRSAGLSLHPQAPCAPVQIL